MTPKINKKKAEIPVLSNADWSKYEQILDILEHPYAATIKMQAEQMTPSDFFTIWLDLKLKLSKHKNVVFAKDILEGMERGEREKNIINAPPILASVFLDSRYRVLLTLEQKQSAFRHLENLWGRMKKLQDQTSPHTIDIQGAASSGHITVEQDVEYDDLAQLLNAKKLYASEIFCADNENALQRVELMPQQTRLSDNTLAFWSRQKESEANLYKLATTVNACAATQVCVERSFSGLAYILNPYRSSLNDDQIENILVVRQNSDILESFTVTEAVGLPTE